ncbi:hypothetical protein [Odoribacter lunatus]|uniref:hypothetical protein n=1 Tax=Odoribacter lunatus TaxID=2941335 RepID=UPI00203E4BA0|nr:hypothetical protein [Odoribacter lunatus]
MSIYTDKIAYLVSLIEQLKRYPLDDLFDLLEVAHVESVLDMPEIADRNWENDTPSNQRTFLRFLDICTSTYEETLNELKEGNNSSNAIS